MSVKSTSGAWVILSETRPFESSSCLANLKRLVAVRTLEVGLVEWFAVVEIGGLLGVVNYEVHTHEDSPLTQYGSQEQATSHLKICVTLPTPSYIYTCENV